MRAAERRRPRRARPAPPGGASPASSSPTTPASCSSWPIAWESAACRAPRSPRRRPPPSRDTFPRSGPSPAIETTFAPGESSSSGPAPAAGPFRIEILVARDDRRLTGLRSVVGVVVRDLLGEGAFVAIDGRDRVEHDGRQVRSDRRRGAGGERARGEPRAEAGGRGLVDRGVFARQPRLPRIHDRGGDRIRGLRIRRRAVRRPRLPLGTP